MVLIHGIAGSSTTWRAVMPALAEHYTVIAPDLLGHGQSAKPRGDYSLGAYASGIRDLMAVLGQERCTVVGHSLGGGVAMQLAYQFPERVQRLVLVASGGLGKEVSPLLKAVTLPGAEYVLPLLLHRRIREAGEWPASVARRAGWRPGDTLSEVWRSYTTLTDRHGQQAFIHTVRAVIDVAGQRVSAHDRLYLAAALPTLIVWGDRDRIIPVAHAYRAAESIPGARLEILEGSRALPTLAGRRPVPPHTRRLPEIDNTRARARSALARTPRQRATRRRGGVTHQRGADPRRRVALKYQPLPTLGVHSLGSYPPSIGPLGVSPQDEPGRPCGRRPPPPGRTVRSVGACSGDGHDGPAARCGTGARWLVNQSRAASAVACRVPGSE